MSKTLTPAQQRRKEYQAKWYQENRERIGELHRKWRNDNKNPIRETLQKYYRKNRKQRLAAARKWRLENKERFKAYQQKWYSAKCGPKNLIPCCVCGAQLSRGNAYDVCSRTPECRAVRQRRSKAARLNERCA